MADQIAQILAQMQQLPGQQIAPIGQMQTASAPFTWGQGGARLSPEQLAAQQASAQGRMKSDYSPVQSIWQGLGRVADNVTGALDARSLDKESLAQSQDADARIAALLPNADPNVVAGLSSRDPRVSGIAELLFKAQQPKQAEPDAYERTLAAQNILPGTPEYIAAMSRRQAYFDDPIVNASVGGRDFFGPRSTLLQNLGGGGQSISPQPVDAPASPAGGGFMTLGQFQSMQGAHTFKPGHPAWATPVQITGDADYDRLPSGKTFIGPDGIVRTK